MIVTIASQSSAPGSVSPKFFRIYHNNRFRISSRPRMIAWQAKVDLRFFGSASGALMSDAEQQKVVSLDRGLFFVNYKSAEDPSSPPHVTVAPADGHERRMEIILHPDATEPTLWEPNSGLVVRVNTPGTLQVQVQPMRPGGSRAAMVRIEPIQSGRASVAAPTKREHGFAYKCCNGRPEGTWPRGRPR